METLRQESRANRRRVREKYFKEKAMQEAKKIKKEGETAEGCSVSYLITNCYRDIRGAIRRK
jgi:hypothetical protein